MKHLRKMSDVTNDEIMALIKDATNFQNGAKWTPESLTFVANLFYESSTRTKCSFEVAQRRLGLQVLPFEVGTSSVNKGESLYDTVKTLESLGVSAVVIRHPEEDYFNQLQNVNTAIINGGDGCGNHPTQSLLDIMTIYQEFKRFAGLKITIIGDIRHSRVARSNEDILQRFGAEVRFVAPPEWMDESYQPNTYITMEEAIQTSDVIMLLRIQHERHDSDNGGLDEYHQKYGMTIQREKEMKAGAIIMHPAPINRGVEIASELVECGRSRIFKQMENGLYMRMAVLKKSLTSNEGGMAHDNLIKEWKMA
ncbi:aspartate carbamoyltransferase catalytic subunit [Sutcliffiella rhizosphaerae]|uniref:Aspartate carbamoyltransferase n=1 Tax=Sutcliffiella rhizosphaerae TaxID=2880967 RepID=A0ABN8AAR8_9BACI|nr:aspartate carbamoyltransferase catalytic subunit [Sutcliffiella rhizosphaerae]CAG9619780.1 Aspartate carbamoyltransferase [Sutcliffiella rhizosphaerae]